jgi:MscS family membrane protein
MRFRLRPLFVGLTCLMATAAIGQDVVGPTQPAVPVAGDGGLVSPRSTLRGFLDAARAERWDVAATHLNLTNLPPRRRQEQGPELARKLKAVLDRTLDVDLQLQSLSAAPDGNPSDGQPEGRDLVGLIETQEGPLKIYVERARGDDGALEWRFSRPTVDKIDRLYDEFGHEPPFAAELPAFFFTVRVLDTALWQWVGLLALGLGGLVVAYGLGAVLLALARIVVRVIPGQLDDAMVEMAVGPLRLTLGVGFARALLPHLWLPLGVHRVHHGLTTGLLVVAATWFAVRMVTVLSRLVQLRMVARGNALGISAIPLVRRVVNALVVLLALVLVLANLGVNMTGVLAGVGVGGLAVALAAQKSLENLFGGITLIMDQPVHVGDLCRFGDRIGTVEDIGLRSTRVRTPERTLLTIPNAEFSSMQIENFAQRDRMSLSFRIGLRYETTPDQLRWLLAALTRALHEHPRIGSEEARVRFVRFGEYALDVELFAHVRTTDYAEFLRAREEVYLRVLEIVGESGTGFAFPSQTVYESHEGLDPEKRRAAETAVHAAREPAR